MTITTHQSDGGETAAATRRHDLDALRALAMLLGVALHASLSFADIPWSVRDPAAHGAFGLLFGAIHGFRMALFMAISGHFTMMLWRRRGTSGMLAQRVSRVFLPCMLGLVTVVPAVDWASRRALESAGTPPPAPGAVEAVPGPARLVTAAKGPLADVRAAYAAFLTSPRFVVRLSANGTPSHLLLTSVFHHLWFLWFLCWLVPIFAAAAEGGRRLGWPRVPSHRVAAPGMLAGLFALTMIPQSLMGVLTPGFGPDTSTGLIPQPHVLAYYGVFFGFGAILHHAGNAAEALGRRWRLWLSASVGVAYPVGLASVDWPEVSALAQAAYAWGMTIGLIGLARDRLSGERPALRYLADSAYWLYLTHLPLVIVLQDWARGLDGPAGVKFVLICATTVAILLAVYEVAVRTTRLGSLLNGGPTPPRHARIGRAPAMARRATPRRAIDSRL